MTTGRPDSTGRIPAAQGELLGDPRPCAAQRGARRGGPRPPCLEGSRGAHGGLTAVSPRPLQDPQLPGLAAQARVPGWPGLQLPPELSRLTRGLALRDPQGEDTPSPALGHTPHTGSEALQDGCAQTAVRCLPFPASPPRLPSPPRCLFSCGGTLVQRNSRGSSPAKQPPGHWAGAEPDEQDTPLAQRQVWLLRAWRSRCSLWHELRFARCTRACPCCANLALSS